MIEIKVSLSQEIEEKVQENKEWEKVIDQCVTKCMDKLDKKGLIDSRNKKILGEDEIIIDTAVIVDDKIPYRLACIMTMLEQPVAYICSEKEAEQILPGKVPPSESMGKVNLALKQMNKFGEN